MIRQKLNISLHSRLQLRERLEVERLVDLAAVALHRSFRVVVRERQHAAPSVLDEHDLARPEEVLGDQDGSESVFGVASGVANDVRVA